MAHFLRCLWPLGKLHDRVRRAETSAQESTQPSDQELVELFQAGDKNAFDTLVRRHQNPTYRLICTIVKNEADAWDVTQETFVKVWKALDQFRAEAQFCTWLYRVAHNSALDWLRRRKARPEHAIEAEAIVPSAIEPKSQISNYGTQRPDAQMEQKERMSAINHALDRLTEAHRSVILLKDVQGLKYSEIASILGCSEGTVMSRIFHARKQLQAMLEPPR